MPTYCVRWTIDIDADTPDLAAREALRIQRDPDSIAMVFEVRDQDSKEALWHPIDVALCAGNDV
jgi:hypothetical protein